MHVLITGAYGTLGRAIVRRAVQVGHQVTCFDLPNRKNKRCARGFSDGVETVWGDVADTDTLGAAVHGKDGVVHLAALLPPATEKSPERAHAINVQSTRHIIDVIENGSLDTHLIFPSSMSVYGPGKNGGPPRGVDEPVIGTDVYTRGKVACETMLQESSIKWTIFRVAASTDAKAGKGGDPEILRVLFNASAMTRIEYIHPDDAALAVVNALGFEAVMQRILNLGGGESCRIYTREFFNAVFGAMGLSRVPEQAFGDGAYYSDWLDTEESNRLLNYQQHSFEDFTRRCEKQMRSLRPWVSLIRPLADWGVLRYSEAWRTRKK
ncbi:MAG: NAD(P)-dependent oxidoreductase [Proteobacteria bacterium]|nr:NAD(P)-dependent oxidoreductase [Pseudomonadota bacterium]